MGTNVGIPRKNPTTTDQNLDGKEVVVGGNTRVRERVVLAGGETDEPVDVSVKQSASDADNALLIAQQPTADTGAPGAQSLVANTPKQLAAANDARKGIIIQVPLTASASVYIGTSNTVAIGSGIEVRPGGHMDDDTWKAAVWAIASASQDIVVWERSG